MSVKYIFDLGRKWELSQMELNSVLGKGVDVLVANRDVMVVDVSDGIDNVEGLMARLGGTVKIAEVVNEIDRSEGLDKEFDWSGVVSEVLIEKASELGLIEGSGKLAFGVSLYSFSQSHEKFLKFLLKDCKKILRKADVSSRFVNKPWKSANNVAVLKEGLIGNGVEVVIVESGNGFYVGKTLAIQDFESYSKRDFDKPRRNPKRGMLPPKLAQMMINLGVDNLGQKGGGVIYDPFCGNATVLMEAMLMGFDVIGSDLSQDAVMDSIENLRWLQKEYPETQKCRWFVFQKDVMELGGDDVKGALENINKEAVDVIVTESYLGPPMSRFPDEGKRQEVDQELSELMKNGFGNFKVIFGEEVPIVLTLPIYRNGKDYFAQKETIEKIETLGYSAFALLDGKESLIYDRPDQIVGRELFKFSLKRA